jgi:hypothetical protein
MSTPLPVQQAFDSFQEYLEQFESAMTGTITLP